MGNSVGGDQTVEYQSGAGRMCGSCGTACMGIFVFFGSIFFLGWNEFNNVRNQHIIAHVEKTTVEGDCDPDSFNTNKGVHVDCDVKTLFNFGAQNEYQPLSGFFGAAELTRACLSFQTQIRQWKETSHCHTTKTMDGGKRKVCTYSYDDEWTSYPEASSNFGCHRTSNGCWSQGVQVENHGRIPSYLQGLIGAPDNAVVIGEQGGLFGNSPGYGVNSGLLTQLPTEILQPRQATITNGTGLGGLQYAWVDASNYIRFSKRPQNQGDLYSGKSIGDIRLTVSACEIKTGEELSVIAKQAHAPSNSVGAALVPWDTQMPGTMEFVNWAHAGAYSIKSFVKEKRSENAAMTWILRLVGWLVMWGAMMCVAQPLIIAPDVLSGCDCLGIGELLSSGLSCMLGCINLGVSFVISCVVISVAWVSARPLFAIGGLCCGAVAACGTGYLIKMQKSKSKGGVEDQAKSMEESLLA